MPCLANFPSTPATDFVRSLHLFKLIVKSRTKINSVCLVASTVAASFSIGMRVPGPHIPQIERRQGNLVQHNAPRW